MSIRKTIFIIILTSLIFAQTNEKIHLFAAPDLVKNKDLANNSAYGIMDVDFDYQKLYEAYCNNTSEMENSHFSEKVVVDKNEENNYYLFHLVFKHWFTGLLFKFSEEHRKLSNSWWPMTLDFEFSGQKNGNMWVVDKSLIPETKSSWVGDNLKTFFVYLAFIDMGKNKTRLYCHMIVDAKGCRKVEEVKHEIVRALEKIIELAEKEKNENNED